MPEALTRNGERLSVVGLVAWDAAGQSAFIKRYWRLPALAVEATKNRPDGHLSCLSSRSPDFMIDMAAGLTIAKF